MNAAKIGAVLGISGAALSAFLYHYSKQRQKGQSSSSSCCDEDGVCCNSNRPTKAVAKRDCTVWQIDESDMAANTFNPIRAIVDTLDEKKCNPEKPIIRLSIGDPAVFGNMNPAAEVLEQMKLVLFSNKANGYDPSVGSEAARAAIAERSNAEIRALNVNPEHAYGATHYTAKDVIIASGCSGSLALVIPALANPGDNILVPTPGFSLYTTLCGHFGLECREYCLLPERSWEIDLEQMASQINARTKAILINNPSNPCGSNFSEEHLRQIVALAERYKLPIISDEVYAGMVFSGQKFIPIASVAGSVPVLTVGGLAKRYLIPGWRLGWILLHDPAGNMAKIRPAITRMSQVILGANSVVQAAIPGIFKAVPDSWYSALNQQLEKHAMHCVEKLQGVPGLGVIVPQGSLYLMVQVRTAEFKDIESDVDFSQKLLKEESVFVLPGKCFRAPNFFRVVFCAPPEVLGEACDRIAEFCRRHSNASA